jgi:hypothetical protein
VHNHWAYNPGHVQIKDAFTLASRWLYGVTPQGGVLIWVDPEEGWLWANVPHTGWPWKTFEEIRSYPQPSDTEVIPRWVREATLNVRPNSAPSAGSLVVLRRLTASEAADLLADVMPPSANTPPPQPRADILRSGGWSPEQVKRLWWTIETDDDAHALAAHLPRWWDKHGWPLTVHQPAGAEGAVPPLPARILTELLDAQVRGDVFAACVRRGIGGIQQIKELRPPVIPDDATRIAFPADTSRDDGTYTVDPDRARADLDRYPAHWLDQITCDTGVSPLHIASGWDGDPGHFSVWSDGLLLAGRVDPPAAVPVGEPMRTWHRGFRAFETTQHLLYTIIRSTNRAEVTPEVWMPWQDAEGADEETETSRTSTRALAADTTATRTLTLTRHTVHCPDGTDRHLWQVTDFIAVTARQLPDTERRAHSVHTSEDDALRALDALDVHPPLATVAESAELLGTTRDALAQALSRENRAAARRSGEPYSPRSVTSAGRTTWYDPRRLQAWWTGRPGRGPGRGHTA